MIISQNPAGDRPIILKWKQGETTYSESKPVFFDEDNTQLEFDEHFYLKANLLLN